MFIHLIRDSNRKISSFSVVASNLKLLINSQIRFLWVASDAILNVVEVDTKFQDLLVLFSKKLVTFSRKFILCFYILFKI